MANIPSIIGYSTHNQAALSDAINTSSKDRLAIILHTLLTECNAAVPILERELLIEDFDSSDLDNEQYEDGDEEDGELTPPPKTSTKRPRAASRSDVTAHPAQKRKLYETCIQCGEEYSTLENYSTACEWHEGMHYTFLPLKTALTLLPRRERTRLRFGYLGRPRRTLPWHYLGSWRRVPIRVQMDML